MAAPPPELMDELVEEILLRVPPDKPARLVRAALSCKRWCGVVTDPGFRRRYHQFHRTPPLLGFVVGGHSAGTHFLPCSSFRPPDADVAGRWYPLDARHGRILFEHYQGDPDRWWRRATVSRRDKVEALVVRTPATGEARRLPMPLFLCSLDVCWNAALLCVAPGCDHMECPSGAPFNVILVGRNLSEKYTRTYVYSSEADEWSETASIEIPCYVQRCRANALAGNSIYFLHHRNVAILEYDLVEKELSVIGLPPIYDEFATIVLMSVDDGGGLGFATVRDFSLCVWSLESAPTTTGCGLIWTIHKVVDLKSFPALSKLTPSSYIIAASDDAVGVFVIWDHGTGAVAIDVKSGQAVTLFRYAVGHIIPYRSFCTPALRAATDNEGPYRVASS